MKRSFLVTLVCLITLAFSSCTTEQPPSHTLETSTATATSQNTPTPSQTTRPTPTLTVTSPPPTEVDTQAADATFASLLERVKQADPSVDFTEFRMAYAKTSHYDPYDNWYQELETAMFTALNAKDYEYALKLANDVLEKNYIFPDAHLVAIGAYDGLGQSKQAEYHRYVLKGLIKSILQSGDGKSPESAYVVVLIQEEYTILSVLGIKDADQGIVHINGHSYDVFNGVDSKSKNPVTVNFNIDIPFNILKSELNP